MGAGGTLSKDKAVKPAPVQKVMSSAKNTDVKKKVLKKKKVTPQPATGN